MPEDQKLSLSLYNNIFPPISQVVEYACQKTKDYDRLAFLYVLTGERGKLEKMRKMAELRRVGDGDGDSAWGSDVEWGSDSVGDGGVGEMRKMAELR